MRYLIAVPTKKRGDYLDFWHIYEYAGGEVPRGAIRFNTLSANMERIERLLKQAKKDYLADERTAMQARIYTPCLGDKARMRLNKAVERQLIKQRQNTLGV